MQPPVRIEVDRTSPGLLHRQKEGDLRIAAEQWFDALKALVRLDPEFGHVTDRAGRRISDLRNAPDSWIDWFRDDRLVVNFSTPEGRNDHGAGADGQSRSYRNIALSYGTPGDMPSRLAITASPALTRDPDWLLSCLSNSIRAWDGEEARIGRTRAQPWVHWLKGGKEPAEYARTPMPEGWSEHRPLLDGTLYLWPENAPGAP